MSSGGAVPATASHARGLLTSGHSVGIHIGGIAEMFEAHPDKEVVHLSRRRGFLRFAVQHGVPVVPMYHFGNSTILAFWPRCVSS
jgi:diacylglycerol O-acyltransferase 2, plant